MYIQVLSHWKEQGGLKFWEFKQEWPVKAKLMECAGVPIWDREKHLCGAGAFHQNELVFLNVFCSFLTQYSSDLGHIDSVLKRLVCSINLDTFQGRRPYISAIYTILSIYYSCKRILDIIQDFGYKWLECR